MRDINIVGRELSKIYEKLIIEVYSKGRSIKRIGR